MGIQAWGENTYSLVELGTDLSARGLGLLLVLPAAAGQLALDLCGGLVDVGCYGAVTPVSAKVEASRGQ